MSSGDNSISPVSTTRPYLQMSTASINSEPVELESTPISPERMRRRGSKFAEEALTETKPEDLKQREDLMRERKADPAVLVDIGTDGPDPDQLEQAGTTTQQAGGEATNAKGKAQ